jgi:hypothetical protein
MKLVKSIMDIDIVTFVIVPLCGYVTDYLHHSETDITILYFRLHDPHLCVSKESTV